MSFFVKLPEEFPLTVVVASRALLFARVCPKFIGLLDGPPETRPCEEHRAASAFRKANPDVSWDEVPLWTVRVFLLGGTQFDSIAMTRPEAVELLNRLL